MADKHKILIVEDDKYIINFISMSLKKEDYDYVIAKTCGEANALFYANRPDMIILDLGLPDGDGIEIIKKCKRNLEDTDHCGQCKTGRGRKNTGTGSGGR